MDDSLETIKAYNQLIYAIYDREELVCLSDNGYVFKNQNVLSYSNPAVVQAVYIGLYNYASEIINRLNKPEFNDMMAEQEIILTTADLKYRLGTIYLYYPYIVKLKESYFFHGGEKQYQYNQTQTDARFNREIPIAFEALYKFWQRLLDYLLFFFPEGMLNCNGKSYFHTPIKYILKEHPNLCKSENFQWLIEFSKNQYPEFNKKRKFFVHTAGYDNSFFESFLKAHNSEKDIIIMDTERADLLEFLKKHLNLCNEGYFKVMDFLNELVFLKSEAGIFQYSLVQNN